jgi:3-oxoacyl-[acyl-carrier protein] reductase
VGKLANKVAVVTGASKGIGAAIARHLAAEGAAVVVNYSKSQEGADRVVRDIVSAGGKAIAVGANLAIETEIAKLFEATKNHFGRVDILVNDAGVYTFAPIEAVTPELYNRMFNTNVLGLLLTTKAALPLFPSTGGSVVNIGSVASTLAPPSASLYAASKAAVDAITKVLAPPNLVRCLRGRAWQESGTSGHKGRSVRVAWHAAEEPLVPGRSPSVDLDNPAERR